MLDARKGLPGFQQSMSHADRDRRKPLEKLLDRANPGRIGPFQIVRERYGPVAWVTVQTGSLGSTRTDRELR
ncbi:hypothetical protein [Sorangium sp. So ce124]|uniref:hypothetical protein n=1 Tax=Sorangium sp. So ce124 TaxID=3133280 RepID=UPI003F61BF04